MDMPLFPDGQNRYDPAKNLELFRELLTCGSRIYSWTYSCSGEILGTNCTQHVLDTVLEATGCKAYMLRYGEINTAPLVLSAPLGLMWCAAFQRSEGVLEQIHLIGPVFNTELSLSEIDRAVQRHNIPLEWRTGFKELLQNLPVVSSMLFFQYALMLHYCVTGEKLARGDIQFQEAPVTAGEHTPAPKNRYRTWMTERALLRNVREGDLHYQEDLDRAGQLSGGVRIFTGSPMTQAIVTEAVFIALCVRAAIDGGLSPETAYSLGDSYIQSLFSCKGISDLHITGHTMYEDFIQRVHKIRSGPAHSQQIIACRDYIELHPEEALPLAELAKRVGYSPQHLSRRFKSEMGVGVSDYIRFVRVERARSMLAYTEEPIREIAKKYRFVSSSYFAKQFQSVTGMLPQQYREKHQKI